MERTLRVLHLDDNFAEIKKVRDALRDCGLDLAFDLRSVAGLADFDAAVREFEPDVAIVDVRLSEEGEEGLGVVERLRGARPGVVVIMCSALDDVGTVKKSLQAGADDFLSKSCDGAHLALRVANAWRLASLKRGLGDATDGAPAAPTGALAKSVPDVAGGTLKVLARRLPGIQRSAVTAVHVRGESGTGKEVVADMFASLAGSVPFVRVNCGGITPTLLESELFGHAKGAFTGAQAEKRGYVEEASGGWLFLDEVALLSMPAQVALLRVLENGEIVRVGETRPRKVNTRVVSAANEPLETLVASGRFRRDLWQRLQEVVIELPPLRERREEIPQLVAHFCRTMAGGPYEITQSALDVLCEHPWEDGNVRELRNCLRAMTAVQMGKLLTPLSIPDRIWEKAGAERVAVASTSNSPSTSAPASRAVAEECAIAKGNGDVMAEEDGAEGASTTPGVRLVGITPSEGAPVSFDHLSNLLFLECIKRIGSKERIPSMRALARVLEVSPSTVPRRIQVLLIEGYVAQSDLERYLHVT